MGEVEKNMKARNHMEPPAQGYPIHEAAEISTAISLKRIADALTWFQQNAIEVTQHHSDVDLNLEQERERQG